MYKIPKGSTLSKKDKKQFEEMNDLAIRVSTECKISFDEGLDFYSIAKVVQDTGSSMQEAIDKEEKGE